MAARPVAPRSSRPALDLSNVAVCTKTHGAEWNVAHVYGHFDGVRTCIRLFGSNTWIYDPRWEKR